MRRIILPIFLLTCLLPCLNAQELKTMTAASIEVDRPGAPSTPRNGADAGTQVLTLFSNAQSNTIEYLCLGDSMNVSHFGGSLIGDPVPATPPGFSYTFYECAPTITGPNWASFISDPCHPPGPPAPPVIIQSNIAINGDATFFNNGQIQTVFNGGAPMEGFFAPLTVDNFSTFQAEADPITGEVGPCMDIGVSEAFSIVYLNGINGSNFNQVGCFGTLTTTGGLPEYDGSVYQVSIVNNADATVVGKKTNTTQYTHNTDLIFSVPEPGSYTITISDDVSCEFSIVVDMTSCTPPELDIEEITVMENDMDVCVGITVNNFTDVLAMDFTLLYDPTVVTFTQVNFTPPPSLPFAFSPMAGQIVVAWGDNFPASFADGTEILEVCFNVIGNPGENSIVEVADGSQPGITAPGYGTNLGDNDLTVEPGNIQILGGPLTINSGSCSTLNGANPTGFFFFDVTGVPPFSYNYVNTADASINGSGTLNMVGETGTSATDLPPGDYDLTITDSGFSTQMITITIANAPTLTPSLTGMAPMCQGQANGTVTLNTTTLGGVAPHTINWSTGPADDGATNLTGLTAGVYNVTVTDNNGCVATVGEGIPDPPLLSIVNTDLTNLSCTGNGMDGSITVEGMGGTITTGYTYSWDSGPSTPTISNLMPGTYCVTVEDNNGCMVDDCYTITQSVAPTLMVTATPLGCPGDMTGTATVDITPGDGMITDVTWSNSVMGTSITNIGAGTYYVTVQDDAGCSIEDSVTLVEPAGLFISNVTITPPLCVDSNEGQIAVTADGGTGSYSFSWNTGGTGSAEFGLTCNDTYTVLISDNGSNCAPIDSMIFIPCPPAITADVQAVMPVDCNGGLPCDGSATVIPSGGTTSGNYFFNWDNGTNQSGIPESTLNTLCQGINTVSIFDDNACEFITTVDIPAPEVLTLDQDPNATMITPASCDGSTDGSIVVQGLGGIGPYDYAWQGGPMTAEYSGLAEGDYTVTIFDDNDCEFVVSIPVTAPEPLAPFIVANNTSSPTCAGDTDGTIEVAWTGGNLGTNMFMWSGSTSTTNIADNLSSGPYSVTVTDELGCMGVADTILTEPTPITFDPPIITPPACFGEQGSVMVVNPAGGTGFGYAFSVDMSTRRPIDQVLPVLGGDGLELQVFDSNGCSSSELIDIMQPDAIFVEFGNDQLEVNLGESTTLDPSIIAPLGVDSIIWSPLTGVTCIDETLPISDCDVVEVNNQNSQAYTITVVDAMGCTASDEIFIEVNKTRNVYIPNAFSPDDNGRNDEFEIHLGDGIQFIESVHIFDRWGEVIRAQENIQISSGAITLWDGYFKGKLMNPGVYVYLIKVKFIDDESILFRGDFTLLR